MFPSLAERLGNTKAAKASKKNRTSIDDASLGVIGQYFQQNLFELLERVPLIDLVFPSGVSLPDDLRKQVLTLTENASHEYHKNKAEFRKHQLAIMDAVDLYHENETAGIFAYNRAYRAYKKLATSCDPEPIPLCNTLLYKYDYGDRWEVRLTCEEVYLTKNGWDYPDAYGYVSPPITKEHILITTEAYDRYNKPVAETLRKSIAKVLANHRPICINADGLSVMDDVGGISGYCDFLAAIHEGPEGDRQSRSDWAKSQGWTGRRQAL